MFSSVKDWLSLNRVATFYIILAVMAVSGFVAIGLVSKIVEKHAAKVQVQEVCHCGHPGCKCEEAECICDPCKCNDCCCCCCGEPDRKAECCCKGKCTKK